MAETVLERIEVWPGRAYPLGATYDGQGTNFALFSEVAEAVDLCLFDDEGSERRVRLEEVDAFSWHGYLPGGQARPALRLSRARPVTSICGQHRLRRDLAGLVWTRPHPSA
jgi:pullulanase/glycogen debranching enzyme